MGMGFAKKALRCLLWLVAGAVGGVALLWLGASAYFLIAGRDIAPPDLSAYQLPHPKLKPDEDAYTYMREYARGVKTNLNWNAAQAYIRGTANRRDCEGIVKDILIAESNAFRCAKGIIASRGISTPSVNERYSSAFCISLCLRMVHSYRLKAVHEAANGDIAAGRATLLELFRLGSRVMELDESMAQLLGLAFRSVALGEMQQPLFAPDGDVAWLAEMQKMAESMTVGDVERAKRAAELQLAWGAADGFWEGRAQRACRRFVSASDLNWTLGYERFSFQRNRVLVAMKEETDRFISKLDAPYDVEYARRFDFGRRSQAPVKHVNYCTPLCRNWIGKCCLQDADFGGSYVGLFQRRSVARSMETVFACRRYRAKHGRYPEKLDDLVPEFIAAVPLDPFDGKPLRYNNEHHYVWTVGEELAFNGDVDFTPEGKPMWISTRSRDCRYVAFLSPEGERRPEPRMR